MPENGYSLPLNTLILISVLIKTTLEDRGLYQFFLLVFVLFFYQMVASRSWWSSDLALSLGSF